MTEILHTSAGYIAVMLLGYLARSIKAVRKADALVISRIILNITLPCAMIMSFETLEVSWAMLAAALLAVSANVTLLLAGLLVSINDHGSTRALTMLNMTGFNVSMMTIPIIMLYFDESLWVYALLFSMGNMLICSGPNNALAHLACHYEKNLPFSHAVSILFKTLPFLVFALLCILSFMNVSLPGAVVDFASLCGSANSFLLFFMIGLMMDFSFTVNGWRLIGRILGIRLLVTAFLSLLIYFVFPLEPEVRKILVLCIMAPVSETASLFSLRYRSQSSIPASCSFLSLLLSMLITFILILLFT